METASNSDKQHSVDSLENHPYRVKYWHDRGVSILSSAEIPYTLSQPSSGRVHIDVDIIAISDLFRELADSVSVGGADASSFTPGNELLSLCVDLYDDHPETAHAILEYLFTESLVHPDVFAEKCIDAISNPNTNQGLRSDIFNGLMYKFAHSEDIPDSVFKIIEKSLDDSESIYKLSAILDFVGSVFFNLEKNSESDSVNRLRQKLSSLCEISDLPFFIKLRIEDILSDNKGVHNSAVVRGDQMRSINTYLNEARSVILSRFDKTEHDRAVDNADALDYAYMMSSDSRKEIEERLGLEFNWLLPEERLYFLRFLKNSDENRVNQAAEFFIKHSLAGIRTFIAVDYDEKVGDKILSYGLNTEGIDDCENIDSTFENFEIFLDQADVFVRKIVQSMKLSEMCDNTELEVFAKQLKEAFIRKAKDFLVAEIDSIKYNVNDGEPRKAIKGVGVSLHIINEFFDNDPAYSIERLEMPKGQMQQFLITDLSGRTYRLKFNARDVADKNGQARINIEVYYDTEKPNKEMARLFAQTTKWHNNPKRQEAEEESVFRLGFDLDTYNPENPYLSLDMGRPAIESDKRSATGDVVGNILQKVSAEGTHSQFSFDKKFSNPELFSRAARSFQQYIESR